MQNYNVQWILVFMAAILVELLGFDCPARPRVAARRQVPLHCMRAPHARE
jgi:hypothetical protein